MLNLLPPAQRNAPAPCSVRASRLASLLLLLAALGASGTLAARAPFWIPSSVPPEELPATAEIYYEGLSGRLVGLLLTDAAGLESKGGRPVDLGPEETSYIAFVEDAERADFHPPTRVLLRSNHEVLLASRGETPRLTEASLSGLRGLQEIVLIDRTPIPRQSEATDVPEPIRGIDPMISEMVESLTEANYAETWQTIEDFVTRFTLAPENTLASQWILAEFASFGLDAEFHEFYQQGTRRNVIATHPGVADPSKVVYICAHFDAVSPTPYACAPGADDNGSGTAAVIEAARVMSRYRFEYTLKFACFSGEEQGLNGSRAYVADIAASGEDVIGVYNIDMIAYRGFDPEPPDLVIYSNEHSVDLATTLEQVVNDYLPGILEPIVAVENMGLSDHASFWQHGYRAVLAIESEVWGSDDRCPWYHTCDDLTWRYPYDYPTRCAQANLAAAAATALPADLEGSFLVLGDAAADDDGVGGSNGNGDGNLNPGETIELWVTIRNLGQMNATNVSGVLTSESEFATVVDGTAPWDDIPAEGEGRNITPFLFEVSPAAADEARIPLTLTMYDDLDVREIDVTFPVAAPVLAYYRHVIDDISQGNANTIPEPDEILKIPVFLTNKGGQDAHSVQAILSSPSQHVILLNFLAGASTIASGSQIALGPPFFLRILPGAIDGEEIRIDLSISTGAGYETESSFKLRIGSHFFDDFEGDGAWSVAAVDDDATGGRWIRVDPNGTHQDGEPVQPEDDHTASTGTDCFVTGQGPVGGGVGEADVDGGKTTLTSPTFDLTRIEEPRVTYWRWYTNDLLDYPGEDTLLVQISSDAGASWRDLERTAESDNSWQERSFLVTDYITPSQSVVIRFVASDEESSGPGQGEMGGSLVEAAIDDFAITGEAAAAGIAAHRPPPVLHFDPVRPNPATGDAWLSFGLPDDEPVIIRLYSVGGRLVRTLLDRKLEAGIHRIVWDGRGHGGDPVASGIYIAKLQTGGGELTRRIVLAR